VKIALRIAFISASNCWTTCGVTNGDGQPRRPAE
jgi:hypothetical protein